MWYYMQWQHQLQRISNSNNKHKPNSDGGTSLPGSHVAPWITKIVVLLSTTGNLTSLASFNWIPQNLWQHSCPSVMISNPNQYQSYCSMKAQDTLAYISLAIATLDQWKPNEAKIRGRDFEADCQRLKQYNAIHHGSQSKTGGRALAKLLSVPSTGTWSTVYVPLFLSYSDMMV